MRRFLVLLALGAGLVVAGIFLAWGEKGVERATCQSEVQGRDVFRTCEVVRHDAKYWSDHLTVDTSHWTVADGEIDDEGWNREFNDYVPSGTQFEGNLALFWARPLLWFGVGATALTLLAWVATATRPDLRPFTRGGVLGGAALTAFATVLGLGGMLAHAATWRGTSVEAWSPEIGSPILAAGAGILLFGAARFYQADAWQAAGHGGSPLAPLFVEKEAPAPVKKFQWPKIKVRWMATMTTVAALLSLVMLFVPFATKEIGLRTCFGPDGVTDCDNILYHVEFSLRDVFVDPEEGGSATFSYDAFRARYGGPLMLVFIPIVQMVGVLGLAVGASAQWYRRFHPETALRVAAGTWVLCLAWTTMALYQQSAQWSGRPAHSLRPALGAYLGMTSLALLLSMAALAIWRHKIAK